MTSVGLDRLIDDVLRGLFLQDRFVFFLADKGRRRRSLLRGEHHQECEESRHARTLQDLRIGIETHSVKVCAGSTRAALRAGT